MVYLYVVVFQYLYVQCVECLYLCLVLCVVFVVVGDGDDVVWCLQVCEWMCVVMVGFDIVVDQVVGDYDQVWCQCVVFIYYFVYLVVGQQVIGMDVGQLQYVIVVECSGQFGDVYFDLLGFGYCYVLVDVIFIDQQGQYVGCWL